MPKEKTVASFCSDNPKMRLQYVVSGDYHYIILNRKRIYSFKNGCYSPYLMQSRFVRVIIDNFMQDLFVFQNIPGASSKHLICPEKTV